MAGERVQTPTCWITTNDSLVFFGPVQLPLVPHLDPNPQREAKLDRIYSEVPRYVELRNAGLSIPAARRQYHAERRRVFADACAASAAGGGDAAAESVLGNSPIVESVAPLGPGEFRIRLVGLPGNIMMDTRRHGLDLDPASMKRRSLEYLRATIRNLRAAIGSAQTTLIVLDAGYGIQTYGGAEAQAASAQLRHVRNGGSLTNLPSGPLEPNGPEILSVLHNRR